MSQDRYKDFFTSLDNTSPYFKMALEGAAGTGKTFTAALVAAGLCKRIGSTKPLVIFDTETSAKFLKPFFTQHDISVLLKPSRTLSDLATAMDFCDAGGADILIIDSITHVWEKFIEGYKRTKGGKTFISFDDWGLIKPLWKREYSERLVMGRYHIVFTGREGYVWDHEEIEGKKTLVKTGVKMKAEGETAYEPDVLVRMERFERLLGDDKEIWREATVIKDRANLIDGQVFKNPTYENFAPVINFLLADVVEPTPTTSQDDTALFGEEEDHREERQQRKIMLERNGALIDKVAAGITKEAKAMRLSLLEKAYYGETSDTAIASMSLAELTEANRMLSEVVPVIAKILGGEPYVYPLAKVVASARTKHLGVEYVNNIAAAPLKAEGSEDGHCLVSYRDHIVQKYREGQARDKEREQAA